MIGANPGREPLIVDHRLLADVNVLIAREVF
jgi:hypothetical protein